MFKPFLSSDADDSENFDIAMVITARTVPNTAMHLVARFNSLPFILPRIYTAPARIKRDSAISLIPSALVLKALAFIIFLKLLVATWMLVDILFNTPDIEAATPPI